MPAFFFVTKLIAILCFSGIALATGVTSAPASDWPRMLLLDGAIAGNDIVVVGERSSILRSTDAGKTWQPATAPSSATLTGVTFAPGAAHGWAVGHDALILATTDAGVTWQKQWQGENLQDSFLDVLALDAQHIVAIGAYGLFVATQDGGRTWLRRKIIDEDFHLNRITRGTGGDLYIAGEHGTLLHSGDQGATWDRLDSPYDGSFYGILPIDGNALIAYGLRGQVYRSSNQGQTWTLISNEQKVLIATAVKLSNGAIVFAGQSRSGAISRDAGATTVPWNPGAAAIAELIELPDHDLLALGESGATRLPKP